LNYGSASLRDDLYRSASSVMQSYLKAPFGIDGWRFDVASNLVSITTEPDAGSCGGTDDHAIWQEIRSYLKRVNPEALILAEEWGKVNAWMNGKEWDAAMNYNGFGIPVAKWITCQNVHGEEAGTCLTVSQFDAWLRGTLADNPRPAQLAMMNSLGTHDTARFLWRAGGDEWKMKLAMILQMTYVGAPAIYYGDEVGLNGGNDPDNRRTFSWNTSTWNQTLLGLSKTLIRTRKQVSAFSDGSFKTLLVDDPNKLYSYGRWDGSWWAIVVLNNDSVGHDATVAAYQLSIPDGMVLTDQLTGTTYTVTNGMVTIPAAALLGHFGVVLTAAVPTASNH
jgi:alpha-glucosidase